MSTQDKPADNTPSAPFQAPRMIDMIRGGGGQMPEIPKPGSQIKTRQLNDEADKVVDPTKKEPTRRVQQPRQEPRTEPEPKPEDKKPAAKPEPKPEDKKKVSGDDPAVQHFAKRMFGDRFADRLARGPADDKDKDKGTKPAEKKPADAKPKDQTPPPEKKGVQVTKAQPRQSLSAEDISTIARTSAEAAVAASRGAKEDATRKQDEDPTVGLDTSDKRAYEIASYMAKTAEGYKDLPAKILDLAKKKVEYRQEWEKEHHGQKFSWDDEEHSSWLEAAAPEFDEDDWEDARIGIKAEKIADKRLESTNEKIRELETKNASVALKDTIEKEANRSLQEFASELAPNAEWDLTTDEGVAAVEEKEDILGESVVKYATWLKDATAEAVRVYDGNGAFKFDPKTNKLHAWMRDTVQAYEDRLDALPDDQKANKAGQTFLPRAKFYNLDESQQRRYWTIKRDQVLWIIKDSVVTMANADKAKEIAKLKRYAEAHGIEFDEESIVSLRKKAAGDDGAGDKPRKTPEKREEAGDDDQPPSSGDDTRIDTSNTTPNKSTHERAKLILGKLFPRQANRE